MSENKLQIIPLGGLGEFGMNSLALRWREDILVIDAGLMFPEEELLGVDVVVPDITYLIENRAHVRGILLTHAHEDHIGGLPWFLQELEVPVYGTEFTLAYVEGKLEEHGMLDSADLVEMTPGKSFSLGVFTVTPIRTTHSLVDCVSLAIDTPAGLVVHTGDFKIDLSPTDDRPFDMQAFADLGKRGVLALLQDSTNVDRRGSTPSERAVRPALDEVFARSKQGIFFSCFSSSTHRLRIATDLAIQHGRKVALIGRSITQSFEVAQDFGYLDLPDGALVSPGQLRDLPRDQVCVFISGTQGEPMSALSRAAVDNHKHAKILPGDTVLLSSRIIPGNEKSIFRMIDHLYRRQANVVYDDGTVGLIHVSGHASQEELRLMLHILRPKFFVPIHGDYRHLKRHIEVAKTVSGEQKTMLIEDGDILELDQNSAKIAGKAPVGRVCIDSGSADDIVEESLVRDRRHLGENGIVLPILAINKITGAVETVPEIVTRGFAAAEESLIDGARQVVGRTLEASSSEEKADYGVIKEKIRQDLKRYIQKNTSARPMILPVILEI